MATAETSPKVAFITGGARGIGLETARNLGKLGVTVVLGVRDEKRGLKAVAELREQGIEAESIRCDVNDAKDRLAAYEFFHRRYGKLDILVNNAGVWLETPNASEDLPNRTSTVSAEVLRDTFEANFFAPVLLTQLLLPLIRKSPAGRIVNVSSILGSLKLHADPSSPIYEFKSFPYDASKAALNAFTVHLAHELRGTSIKVNSVHPGWVQSEMGGKNASMALEEGGNTSVKFATLPASGPTGGFFHLDDPLPW
jgi:NAD(P)-dependent dehydrogenase (short-subunit alcohol dehydrogenase family)